ncbi:unnamed protein product, partial [Ilex paraguariensis]
GKSGISSLQIVAIDVPIIVAVLLFIIGFCFLVRKAKKKNYDTVMEETGYPSLWRRGGSEETLKKLGARCRRI